MPNNQHRYLTANYIMSPKAGFSAFAILWLLTCLLYLPAAKAGWVIDAAGWLDTVKHQTFSAYINRSYSTVQSLYQFTQLITYAFYKLWGANVWAWSLLYITLHATNAYLLFRIFTGLFVDSQLKNGVLTSFIAALFFLLCPHASEVVIWKACYHYLQGFLFILIIVRQVQLFQHRQKVLYASIGLLIFILSVFSLEVFYLTPVFVLLTATYYHVGLYFDKKVYKSTILYFVVPQLVLMCGYFILFKLYYANITPHVGNLFTQSVTGYLSKPPKLLFNILLLGRFFTIACKEWVYGICETTGFLVAFYGAISGYCVYSIIQFRRSGTNRKLFFLFFLFGAVTLGFLIPLPFPGAALLVFYDRYTYFANAFVYILPAILLGKYLKGWPVYTILTIYLGINVFFTLRLNRYWKHSAYINNRLYNEMPAASGKTILLLNLPENLNGVPMIGAQPESEFKSLHDLFTGIEIKNKIYDVQSFNLMTKEDGAHISVINDSTIKVTLNQWGTWWWFEGHGGTSYENADFKLDLVDPGHWYQLTLKHPSNQYQLLFLNSTSWKTVNMSRLNEDQY